MSRAIEILSVNTSLAKGTIKSPQESVRVDHSGIVGDAHAGRWRRQVSLLGIESLERFERETGVAAKPGAFGENLTLGGLPEGGANVLDRFVFDEVELEVTQIGKECHGAGCAIFQQAGKCVMPAEGLFSRVIRGGTLRPGRQGRRLPRTLRVHVITLSDRAAAGVYQDRSGPRIAELLAQFSTEKRWQIDIQLLLLSDDAQQLRQGVSAAVTAGADVILTTGGTGVGPRDITPEVIGPLCDKLIPGIMEHIRLKFGETNPNALLSRSIAGILGQTQVYTLPGSVRAVEQYLAEILRTLEHLVFMLRGVDVHGREGP